MNFKNAVRKGYPLGTLIMSIAGTLLLFAPYKNMGWLEELGWGLCYQYLGRFLFWLGSTLLFAQLLSMLFFTYVLKRKLPVSVLVINAFVFVLIAWIWLPDDISVEHYESVAPNSESMQLGGDEDAKLRTTHIFAIHRYADFAGIYYMRNGETANNATRQVWKGSHNLWSGEMETSEIRPVGAREISDLIVAGVIKNTDPLTDYLGKGFECVTRTDTYVGPLVIIHYIRSLDDLDLVQMSKLCKLVPLPEN